MKKKVGFLISAGLLFVASGCSKSDQPLSAQASEARPSGIFSSSQQESKKLLNSYPQYGELRHPDLEKVTESLPEYRHALADREARIKAKVGNISDSELRLSLIKQAGIPEVSKSDFYELAKKEIERRRAAFLAEHKDCYFILGTYDFYLPKKQMVVFNLQKMGVEEHADDLVRSNGFGASIPYRQNKNGDYVDAQGKILCPECLEPGGPSLAVLAYAGAERGTSNSDWIFDSPGEISSRYSPDWLDGGAARIHYGLLVPMSVDQLDKLYAAVRTKFSKQMDDIYASEMKVGGDYIGDHFATYCDRLPCDRLKKDIESYVRRQAIWVLAQGDPMDPARIQVDKAWVVVGGPDIVLTLK
jgi:hypothetical protein